MFFSDGFGFDSFSKQSNNDINNTTFYETLNISKEATPSEIKKSYYKLAKQHHPDKGGDEVKFKKIQLAFEVLRDPEKKKIYDKYGEEGLKQEAESSGATNLFDFFRGKSNRPRRGKNIAFELGISLEEIYNQTSKKLKLTKNVICKGCKGSGTKSGKSSKCDSCGGRGIKISIKQVGPGMVQQTQSACHSCRGTGEQVKIGDRCKKCRGSKVIKEEKIVDVLIEKGVKSGTKITYRGEADERPGVLPGDVIVTLREKKHSVFGREGMNLFLKKCITLTEALCGAELIITHLDNRTLKLNTFGSIISPREVYCIENEGMPLHTRPFIKGGMFVEFDIKFPSKDDIKEENLQKIKEILNQPTRKLNLKPGTYEEPKISKRKVEELRSEQRKFTEKDNTHEDEDDDENEHMGYSTGCPTQ